MVQGAGAGKVSVVTAAGIKDVMSTTYVAALKVIFMNTAVARLNMGLTVIVTALTRNACTELFCMVNDFQQSSSLGPITRHESDFAYALKIEDIGSVKLRFNNSTGFAY